MGGGVAPEEFDAALGVVAEEAFGVEGAAVDVSGEVAQGGFSLACGLELDVPFCDGGEGAVLFGGEFGVDLGVVCFEGGLDETAEAGGEGLVVDEEVVGLFWVDELVLFWVVGDGGDDAVNVRVVLHLAAPGVEDAGDAELEVGGVMGLPFRLSAAEFGGGDVMEGLGAAFEEEVVEFFGPVEAEAAKFCGNGEGDEEVRDL